MTNVTTPVDAVFEMQRESIKQSQQLFESGLDLQRNAAETALQSGIDAQRSAQRQATDVYRDLFDAQAGAIETAFDAGQDDVRAAVERQIDEGALLTQELLNAQFEQGVEVVQQLGVVSDIIAPSRMHDLFLQEWQRAIPEARFWIPKGIGREFDHVVDPRVLSEDSTAEAWENEVKCVWLRGMPRLNEYAFFHIVSGSLIVADLLFNIGSDSRFLTRMVARLGGFYGRLAIPHDIRWWYVRDREALKDSVEEILGLPLEHGIIGHGMNGSGNGKARSKEAWRWLIG
jgi:hypothetical protein